MEIFIHKIYPVLYSDQFGLNETTITQSACVDPKLLETREKLLYTTLRFGTAKANKLADKKSTLEDCTSFKPFNVRETGWDAWGDSLNKENIYLANFEQIGLLDGNMVNKSGLLSNSVVTDVMMPRKTSPSPPIFNVENVDSQDKLITEKKEEEKEEEKKSEKGLSAEEFAKELREQNDPSRDIIVPSQSKKDPEE